MRRSLRLCKKRKTEKDPQSPATLKDSNSDVIPLDLLIEVLNRLPAKSVGRFLLVSKSWAKIIRSNGFIRWFPFRSLTQPLRFLIALPTISETGHRNCRLLTSSSLSSSSTSISTSFLSGITPPPPPKNRRGSYLTYYYVNGLMNIGEVIFNPCTGKSITLPSVKTGRSTVVRPFFGYDPVNDEYKVLRMTNKVKACSAWSDFQVFTLGAKHKQKSWRLIDCSVPHRPLSSGLCIDGAVYYIARTGTEQSVVRFDLKSEKFDIFARVSHTLALYSRTQLTLINYHGKVARAVQPFLFESTIDLFVFEAGKQDFRERSFHNLPQPWLLMKGINHMGEVIFAPSHASSKEAYVICYDLKGSSWKKIKIEIDANRKCFSGANYFVGYVESLMLL